MRNYLLLSVSSKEDPKGPYILAVYGIDLKTEEVSIWPCARLRVGDEVRIKIVETDQATEPTSRENISPQKLKRVKLATAPHGSRSHGRDQLPDQFEGWELS